MTVFQDVTARIEKAEERLKNDYFDVVEFQQEVGDLLKEACSEGGECDSGDESRRLKGEQAYRAAAFFLATRFPVAAEDLLIRWWNEISTRQLTKRTRIYRAMTAFTLCQLYLEQKDFGASLRWALLTHADDRLHKHSLGGGVGMQYLRTRPR